MDFHHIDERQKSYSISRYRKLTVPQLRQLGTELDKCVVICANCHRKLHASPI